MVGGSRAGMDRNNGKHCSAHHIRGSFRGVHDEPTRSKSSTGDGTSALRVVGDRQEDVALAPLALSHSLTH